MNKKYFETKTGSIEEKITQIATEQPSITKQEPNVRLETKTYFETKPGSISDVASKIVSEALDPVNKDAVKKSLTIDKIKILTMMEIQIQLISIYTKEELQFLKI